MRCKNKSFLELNSIMSGEITLKKIERERGGDGERGREGETGRGRNFIRGDSWIS